MARRKAAGRGPARLAPKRGCGVWTSPCQARVCVLKPASEDLRVHRGGTIDERRAQAKAEHGRGVAMARCVARGCRALARERKGGAHRKLAGGVLRRSRARGARVGDPVCDLDGGVGVAASGEAAWRGATAKEKRWTSSRSQPLVPANRYSTSCSPPAPPLCCSPSGEVAGIEAGGGRCGEERKERGRKVLGKTPIAARAWRWWRRGFIWLGIRV
jgi:hypothetical protein